MISRLTPDLDPKTGGTCQKRKGTESIRSHTTNTKDCRKMDERVGLDYKGLPLWEREVVSSWGTLHLTLFVLYLHDKPSYYPFLCLSLTNGPIPLPTNGSMNLV